MLTSLVVCIRVLVIVEELHPVGGLHPVLHQAGITARARYEAGSIELMKQLALRGLGVALMTKVGVEDELAAGRLVHVPLRQGRQPILSELVVFTRASSALPTAAEALVEHLKAGLEGL